MSIRFIARQTKLMSLLLAAMLTAWAASPGLANLLVNGDFEQPSLGKITSGWDPVPAGGHPGTTAPAGSDVPAWHSAGFPIINVPGGYHTDSGVESTGNKLPGSTYSAFSNNCDSDLGCTGGGIRAHQISNYVIQAGDSFQLSVFARPLYTFDANWAAANATMHWVVYAADNATDVFAPFDPSKILTQGYFDLGLALNSDSVEPYQFHTTGPISAGAGFAGKLVGISLYNSSGGVDGDPPGAVPAMLGRSWIGFDNVDLSISVVPEPSAALLVLVGGLLVCCSRRSQR
jgi:hypothetical protein